MSYIEFTEEELQALRDDLELLRADAKRVMRAAKVTVQLAARSLERLDNVQSKEDTTDAPQQDEVEES